MITAHDNWSAACLAMLEGGVSEKTVIAITDYAQRYADMLNMPHDLPVQIETGWQAHNLIAGQGKWDVTHYLGNPGEGRAMRFCVMLPR